MHHLRRRRVAQKLREFSLQGGGTLVGTVGVDVFLPEAQQRAGNVTGHRVDRFTRTAVALGGASVDHFHPRLADVGKDGGGIHLA